MVALLLAALPLFGGNLPIQTLNGEPRLFPADIVQRRAVIVLTFSKAASDQATEWTRKLRANEQTLAAGIYQIAILEDVPALLRSFVISGLRRSVPGVLHDNFWIVTSSSKEWQERSAATSLNEAQIFVLEDRSQIVWRWHGPFTEAGLQNLLQALTKK